MSGITGVDPAGIDITGIATVPDVNTPAPPGSRRLLQLVPQPPATPATPGVSLTFTAAARSPAAFQQALSSAASSGQLVRRLQLAGLVNVTAVGSVSSTPLASPPPPPALLPPAGAQGRQSQNGTGNTSKPKGTSL